MCCEKCEASFSLFFFVTLDACEHVNTCGNSSGDMCMCALEKIEEKKDGLIKSFIIIRDSLAHEIEKLSCTRHNKRKEYLVAKIGGDRLFVSGRAQFF